MSTWSIWSFHLLVVLSSTINFSTTAHPLFHWDYRFLFFFSSSPSCNEVLVHFASSCLVACPYILLLLPLKKGTNKLYWGSCLRVTSRKKNLKKKASINFHLIFPFSVASLMFLSLCGSFFTCVVQYSSFSKRASWQEWKMCFLSKATAESSCAEAAWTSEHGERGTIIPTLLPPLQPLPLAGTLVRAALVALTGFNYWQWDWEAFHEVFFYY